MMSVVSSSSWINEVYRPYTVHVQTPDIQQDVYKNVVFSLLLCYAPIFFYISFTQRSEEMPWLSLLSKKRNSFKGLKTVVFLRLSTKETKQAFLIQIGTWPSFRSIETHRKECSKLQSAQPASNKRHNSKLSIVARFFLGGGGLASPADELSFSCEK